MNKISVDILGTAVLMDSDGEPYRADGEVSESTKNFGVGVIGGIVLLDPDTGEPYKIGE